MRGAIKESADEMIRRVRREATEGIQRLGGEAPAPQAPSEYYPGNPTVLAGRKKKRSKNVGYA